MLKFKLGCYKPESTLESINIVNTMWEKPPSKAPFTSYAKKLM